MNQNNSKRVYLDFAATTPVRAEAADAMRAALDDASFNPSSVHAEGRRARGQLDDARDRVAALLGVSRKEIAFTGSGSEADNLALAGTVRALGGRGHVVTTSIEHHAVLHALDALESDGWEVTRLPVDQRGLVDPAQFAAALRPDTRLASVMYANNEIGTVQPIARLAAIARERGIVFHTDAVQAPAWLAVRPRELGADLLALSAHKFFGPKGVGMLYVRQGVELSPLIRGGGQEFGRRAGTENVVGIVGFTRALELAVAERGEAAVRTAALRDRLEAGLLGGIDAVRVNGSGAPRLANNLNVSFAGVPSEALVVRLDLEGIAVSAGSACTSGAVEPSHVIAALGLTSDWAAGAIRFSLGPTTTLADVDRVLEVLPGVVSELRGGKIRTARGDTDSSDRTGAHLEGRQA
ncbi:MAG TPA: cysteine desulfurase family protein [Candidatus Baltobacteraceae bacterium]|nr:cysteine desulfurase family protein [Candidatus Baltobacteraceae bacterium]